MARFPDHAGKLLLGCGLAAAVLVPSAHASHFKTIYSFQGGNDGASPWGITHELAGYRYGATSQGGTANEGTVYEIGPQGAETVLHSFTGGSDGAYPDAPPIKDKTANLFGTTYDGGSSNKGTVYKVASDGTERVLYSFSGGDDGANPVASLIEDDAGNLYGATPYGGANGLGVVFELAPDGTETVLHTFGGTDGAFPYNSLIRDAAGNLYGTASSGGANGYGAVFRIAPDGTETVLRRRIGQSLRNDL